MEYKKSSEIYFSGEINHKIIGFSNTEIAIVRKNP